MTFDDEEEEGATLELELEELPEQPVTNATNMKQARNSAMYLFISIPPFKYGERTLVSVVLVLRTFVVKIYFAIIAHSQPKCKR